MTIMADMARIRDELSFKCDGAFLKNCLEGKANKQSVADALHNKANKKTVARENAEIKELIKKQVAVIKGHIEEAYREKGVPVERISKGLVEVAREVREGVEESRRIFRVLEERVDKMEGGSSVHYGARAVAGGGGSSTAGGRGTGSVPYM